MKPKNRYFEYPYTCQNCGSDDVNITNSAGEDIQGEFKERYRCRDCGCNGTVKGLAEDGPNDWSFGGDLFSGRRIQSSMEKF